jgi:hypothetical protein
VFERLWAETGCRAVIEDVTRERKHGFALERAIFLTVLHRLMGGGSIWPPIVGARTTGSLAPRRWSCSISTGSLG